MDKKYFPDMIIEKPRLDGGRSVGEYAQNQGQVSKPPKKQTEKKKKS